VSYSHTQLEALWIAAGGPASQADTAAAIAQAESGGNVNAHNPSGATGLWQILGMPSGVSGSLYSPTVNAEAAVAKYTQAGSSFSPWVTYTQGTYKQYLSSGGHSTLSKIVGDIPIVGGTLNGAADTVKNTASSAASDAGSIASAIGFVFSASGADRILKVLGGGVLIIIALDQLLKAGTGVSAVQVAGKAATTAGKAAAVIS
jgi:lysozyme-like protein